MKSEIIKLRKQIYNHLKNKAMSYESFNQELDTYSKNQREYSKRNFKLTDMEYLKNKVLDNDVIFIGDFHTFDQNIRTVLRILRYIINENTDCILGLEMVAAEDQFYIDTYLEGHLTDLEFLESINYHNSWRFPWTHYKLIFELAKEFSLKVVGLNTQGSLTNRDKFAAQKLRQIHLENPSSIMLVVYGELHIAPNKMPQILREIIPDINSMIIHQNLDEVYWKLITKNLESGIVAYSSDEFCIISAPPWVKYESMIYWYENLCDDPDFDIHEYIIENGKKIFSEDTNDNFFNIANMLVKYLQIDIPPESLEDFNLYDHSNLEFVEEKLKLFLKTSSLKFYNYLISTGKSFRLPKNNTFYCSSYSMNRISYLAGIHILHIIFQMRDINTFEVLQSRSKNKKFILFTIEAMCAYFFSKIINPHRKCDLYYDYKLSVDYQSQSVNKAVLEILDDVSIHQVLKSLNQNEGYELALKVGHILGEYLYLRTQERNQSVYGLKDVFDKLSLTQSYFMRIKNKTLEHFDYQNHQKRMF